MSLLLGVDIGGTHSRAVLLRDGVPLVETSSTSASPTASGLAAASAALTALLTPVRGACGQERIAAACIGSAGGEAAHTREFLRQSTQAQLSVDRIGVVSDAELVVPAAGLEEGVALIAGTGSVAAGRSAGLRAKAGGWGYLLGDEGGGYWTVREAVRAVLGAPGSRAARLEEALCDAFGAFGRADLLQRLHEDPAPRTWARRAPVVYTLAAEGDDMAGSVIARAADELTALAMTVLTDLGAVLPVVLAGGILTSQAVLAADVTKRLRAGGLVGEVHVLTEPPVTGAILLAEQLAAGGHSAG